MFVDHFVLMAQDLGRTEAFYTTVFGKPPIHRTDDYIVYIVYSAPRKQLGTSLSAISEPTTCPDSFVGSLYDAGGTKIFFGLPYERGAGSYNRDAWGLNHWAIGLEERSELEEAERRLTAAGIRHSPIQPCRQSGLPMIWFDDPDGMRVEFYLRGKDKQLVIA